MGGCNERKKCFETYIFVKIIYAIDSKCLSDFEKHININKNQLLLEKIYFFSIK